MATLHVRAFLVVIVREFRNDVVQVTLTEQDEFEQTLIFYGLYKTLDPAVCTRCQLHLIATLRRERFGSRIRFTRCGGGSFCW